MKRVIGIPWGLYRTSVNPLVISWFPKHVCMLLWLHCQSTEIY